MIVYQIKDWNENFENNKSRDRNECSFVCVPNSHSGLGFSLIMAETDGAMVYGIFHLITGACSRQRKPREGWLTENGREDGTPWTPEDLSVQFRRPVSEVVRALEVLSSPKVGWLLKIEKGRGSKRAASARAVPAECPSSAPEEKRREENRIEEKEEKGNAAGAPQPAGSSSESAEQEKWLDDLQANPAYSEIDVRREFLKMVTWCHTKRRKPTRARFVNWINRIDTIHPPRPQQPKAPPRQEHRQDPQVQFQHPAI